MKLIIYTIHEYHSVHVRSPESQGQLGSGVPGGEVSILFVLIHDFHVSDANAALTFLNTQLVEFFARFLTDELLIHRVPLVKYYLIVE